MNKSSLVSILTIVKNGKQFIKPYLKSISTQTYPNIELIIQDGGSIDGTIEIVKSFKRNTKFKIYLESEKDKNGGEALNKAIKRSHGSIACIINADDLLAQRACEIAVDTFQKQPDTAALYGANKFIDEFGKYQGIFKPMSFDLIKLLSCELVPTTNGSFYNLAVCNREFILNEELKTCGDFGLWLKLSKFPILSTSKVLAYTRLNLTSSTRKVENYEQFCKDKIALIEKFIDGFEESDLMGAILKKSISGVYAWAAESILNLEGNSRKFYFYINKSLEYDPLNTKIQQLKLRVKINAF